MGNYLLYCCTESIQCKASIFFKLQHSSDCFICLMIPMGSFSHWCHKLVWTNYFNFSNYKWRIERMKFILFLYGICITCTPNNIISRRVTVSGLKCTNCIVLNIICFCPSHAVQDKLVFILHLVWVFCL